MDSTARLKPWLSPAQAEAFLAERWQRRPQFFAGALPDLPAPPDWRALAADPEVESRRIVTLPGNRYEADTGPFDGADPTAPWTVLLQDAEHHAPALRALFATLPFLPRWRLEDIMMSVAVAGGSVGPHVDRYDVFLVQARGERHWQVGQQGSGVPDPDAEALRLVQPFESAFEALARPGDVLYLPPGVPHHGIAQSDCVTYSIGFRAPALQDLAAVALSQVDGSALLTDAGRRAAPDPHALDTTTVQLARAQLRHLLDDDQALAHALGELVTEPKAWLSPAGPDDAELAESHAELVWAEGVRIATWEHSDGAVLFVNGVHYDLNASDDASLVNALNGAAPVLASDYPGATDLMARLLTDGALRKDINAMTESDKRVRVRTADWDQDRETLRALRFEVFVEEQNVPEDLEWDGEDARCQHALAFLDGRAVGTGRLSPDGKIGRMAVRREARGHGVGAAVLQHLVGQARAAGLDGAYLHAQSHALAFYERAGFKAEGPTFDEAGIDHRHMAMSFAGPGHKS